MPAINNLMNNILPTLENVYILIIIVVDLTSDTLFGRYFNLLNSASPDAKFIKRIKSSSKITVIQLIHVGFKWVLSDKILHGTESEKCRFCF